LPTLTSSPTAYTPRLSSNRLLAGSRQFTVPVSTARAASPMALRIVVASAPFSSLNSRPRRKKAYPLLDLHQNPMNAIPNPPPPNLRIPKRTHLSMQPSPRHRPSRRSSRVPLPPRNPPPLSRARRPLVTPETLPGHGHSSDRLADRSNRSWARASSAGSELGQGVVGRIVAGRLGERGAWGAGMDRGSCCSRGAWT
jgi:hypothetical protein